LWKSEERPNDWDEEEDDTTAMTTTSIPSSPLNPAHTFTTFKSSPPTSAPLLKLPSHLSINPKSRMSIRTNHTSSSDKNNIVADAGSSGIGAADGAGGIISDDIDKAVVGVGVEPTSHRSKSLTKKSGSSSNESDMDDKDDGLGSSHHSKGTEDDQDDDDDNDGEKEGEL